MISIILNVYNGEKYIKRCVESVLAQTYQNFILKYWALEHGINWYVLLNGKYWQFRHQIKAILKLNRKR